MPTITCSQCQKSTYKRPRDIKKSKSGKLYCSLACCGLDHRNEERFCAVCSAPLLGWKRRVTCGSKCEGIRRQGKRYRLTYKTPAVRRNMLMEKRGPRCERCGYDEHLEILVTHHIVERANGGTDDWDNLELLCPNCHSLHHWGKSDKIKSQGRVPESGLSGTPGKRVYTERCTQGSNPCPTAPM